MKKFFSLLLIVCAFLGILFLLRKTSFTGYSGEKNSLGYKAKTYTPSELQTLLNKNNDKFAIIDVRSKLEYDKGHLPGAVHADYYDTDALKKAAGDKIPVTYCAFSAMRGPYAAYQLYLSGYKDVYLLKGGLSAWVEDIQLLESADPKIKTVFNHPKNIFPQREKRPYPDNMGEIEFKITATRFMFNPSQIKVGHGQKVTLHLVSLDVAHGFALPEYGIEVELLPNEPVDVSFIADRKGNFPFVCSIICGSDHASMVGNLIVE